MRNETTFLRAGVALATASILYACSNAASPPTYAPPGSLQSNLKQLESSVGSPASATTYYMLSLATLGGHQSNAVAINARNQITGYSWLKGNKIVRAALWRSYRATDLGTLGGPNSGIVAFNHGIRGQFVGLSQVSATDPYDENFCGFITYRSHICVGFSWRNGKMTQLPTLGGNNAEAYDVNNRGRIVGVSETSTQDPACTAPQVFDYDAVIWEPNGTITTLPPLSGDTTSAAVSINRGGTVVGYSGPCSVIAHAVLWQNGSAIDLGNLGGNYSYGNVLNNRGQVVGYSYLPGNTAYHAFLWQNGTMSDLGTLSGDVDSQAFGINDKGQIVGQSCSASSCRGFIWQNGVMTDLNELIPPDRSLYVYQGGDINNSGQIPGVGINRRGLFRAFVLIPGKKAAVLPTGVSKPPFTIPERPQLQPRRTGAAPGTLGKSIFSL
jgi:probable HAF family extracellular repeat protein